MDDTLIKRAEEFFISECGGSRADFYINDCIEIKSELKIFVFIRPVDFELMKTLGLYYVGVPGPAVYDIIKDEFSMSNAVSFLMEYGEHEEYLAIGNETMETKYTYQDIVNYLDRRGYLITDDFDRVLEALKIEDRGKLSYRLTRSRRDEIIICNPPDECCEAFEFFLKELKADYVIEGDEIFVKKDLLHSSTYYDDEEKSLKMRGKE
ncbi:hypothetical protein [Flavobacterium alkalisoli]|uniref:hypothetical protein n=1 Tax=Flavobacterium alkalisoli TaxID=2602769 RepID=UPI003A8D3272